jgi:hypothetical protein
MFTQPPAENAAEIINNLPSSPNSITKTGSVIPGSESAATAPVPSSSKPVAKYNGGVKAGSYFVFLKDGVSIDSIPISSGSKITDRYTIFNGFAGNFNSLMVVRTRSTIDRR